MFRFFRFTPLKETLLDFIATPWGGFLTGAGVSVGVALIGFVVLSLMGKRIFELFMKGFLKDVREAYRRRELSAEKYNQIQREVRCEGMPVYLRTLMYLWYLSLVRSAVIFPFIGLVGGGLWFSLQSFLPAFWFGILAVVGSSLVKAVTNCGVVGIQWLRYRRQGIGFSSAFWRMWAPLLWYWNIAIISQIEKTYRQSALAEFKLNQKSILWQFIRWIGSPSRRLWGWIRAKVRDKEDTSGDYKEGLEQ